MLSLLLEAAAAAGLAKFGAGIGAGGRHACRHGGNRSHWCRSWYRTYWWKRYGRYRTSAGGCRNNPYEHDSYRSFR